MSARQPSASLVASPLDVSQETTVATTVRVLCYDIIHLMAQRAPAIVVLVADLVAMLFQLLDKEDRDGIVALSNCLNSLRICYQQRGA